MTLTLLCPCGASLVVPATPQGYTRAAGWYARHREHYPHPETNG